MLAGLAFSEMLSQYPQSAFQGVLRRSLGGSAAVCELNPPRPFARSRLRRSGTGAALSDGLHPKRP